MKFISCVRVWCFFYGWVLLLYITFSITYKLLLLQQLVTTTTITTTTTSNTGTTTSLLLLLIEMIFLPFTSNVKIPSTPIRIRIGQAVKNYLRPHESI